jgi:hypothetical protein
MNTKLENKITMWVVLRAFLQQNTATTEALPGFAALFVLLNGTIEQTMVIMDALGIVTTGITQNKRQTRELLILKTAEIAGMIRAYAIFAKMIELGQQMKISKSALDLLSDTALLSKAREVYDKAMELLKDAESYGVTPSLLENLMELLQRYTLILPGPRNAIGNHKHSQKELLSAFEAGDATIEKMDVLIEIIRYSNALFYSDYHDRRRIISTSRRTRALQLWVSDDASGLPIHKAEVTIKRKGGTELPKNIKITGTQGGISVNNMDAGEYLYEVAFGGYITATGSFFVNNGIMTEVNVRMKKG